MKAAGRGGLGLAVCLGAASLALAAAGWSESLEFDRAAIIQGAWWLALTGQLTHFGGLHLYGNVLGALLIARLFDQVPLAIWLRISLFAAVAVALGLLLESEPLDTYRGLSGVLYGWVAGGCVHQGLRGSRYHLWIFMGVAALAAAEASTLGGARLIAHAVFVHPWAHVWGIVGGVSAVLLWPAARTQTSKMPASPERIR